MENIVAQEIEFIEDGPHEEVTSSDEDILSRIIISKRGEHGIMSIDLTKMLESSKDSE